MGITKVTKRISTTVEEDRYVCDYCGTITDTPAIPVGWGSLRVQKEDFSRSETIVCSTCIGNLGKTVVEVAEENAKIRTDVEAVEATR